MFEYEFMRRALLVGLMLSIMIPMIGVIMVNRKTSMVGDALSHTSLAGVGLGLILGFDPIYGALVICVVAGFAIELIRKRFPQYGDMATAIIMSTGLGLAALLSDLAPGGNTFDAYLFGSIASITSMDIIYVSILFVLVVACSIALYGGLLDISIDSNLARLAGTPVKVVNTIFTILSALTIAMACKSVGALLVASLIVLPVATALMVSRSYKQTYLLAIILGVLYMMIGLVMSYHLDVRPGGAIIINAVIGMGIMAIISRITRRVRKKKDGVVPETAVSSAFSDMH